MSQEPEEEFAVLINKVMAKGIQDGADPDTMARICLNTARELYDHYQSSVIGPFFVTFSPRRILSVTGS